MGLYLRLLFIYLLRVGTLLFCPVSSCPYFWILRIWFLILCVGGVQPAYRKIELCTWLIASLPTGVSVSGIPFPIYFFFWLVFDHMSFGLTAGLYLRLLFIYLLRLGTLLFCPVSSCPYFWILRIWFLMLCVGGVQPAYQKIELCTWLIASLPTGVSVSGIPFPIYFFFRLVFNRMSSGLTMGLYLRLLYES